MQAPPAPYSRPTWASARKDMVGASLGSSRLWFTIAEGIVTEVYYPRIDIPQIKDLGFIIADDRGFWVELRRMGRYTVTLPAPGVPAVTIVHTHPRFTFTLEVAPAQRRDTLVLRFRLEGDATLRPYALLASRLGGDADNNLAWVAAHNGRKTLWAEQGPFGLALSAADADGDDAWGRCSAGLPGGERRLAGLQPERPHDVGIRQRGAGVGGADGGVAGAGDAGSGLRAPARSRRRRWRCRH